MTILITEPLPLSFQKLLSLLSAAAAAKSLQSCLTLCDPIDGSSPGSPVPGILQARTLEWVAISFSSAWKWKVKVKSLSRVQLSATPWTAAYQVPLSMGFSRQAFCMEPKLMGDCNAVMIRYFYDAYTGLCELFRYGGCGGNKNNFLTKEECMKTCCPKAQSLW